MRAPTQTRLPGASNARVPQSKASLSPQHALRSPSFWLLYLAFVLVATGGLMTTAQIGPIARDFNISGVPVSLIGITLPALTFAISLDRIFDGFGRPFFGYVSDRIGREYTMGIAFTGCAVALFVLGNFGETPVVFVLASAIYFGLFGEIYSLFPATCSDTFGTKYAATNAGMLYTAKGTAALIVPIASLMAASYGWHAVFVLAMILNVVAACLALLVIRPVRASQIRRNQPASGLADAPSISETKAV
jgi:OFA family oxalate/formate antiporter-like MFS transporter